MKVTGRFFTTFFTFYMREIMTLSSFFMCLSSKMWRSGDNRGDPQPHSSCDHLANIPSSYQRSSQDKQVRQQKHKLCPKSGWSFLSGHIPRYLHHLEKLKQMGREWKHSQLMRVSLRHTRADQTSSGSCHRTIVSIIMPGLPGLSPSSDLALCHITALLWIPVKNHAPPPPQH